MRQFWTWWKVRNLRSDLARALPRAHAPLQWPRPRDARKRGFNGADLLAALLCNDGLVHTAKAFLLSNVSIHTAKETLASAIEVSTT